MRSDCVVKRGKAFQRQDCMLEAPAVRHQAPTQIQNCRDSVPPLCPLHVHERVHGWIFRPGFLEQFVNLGLRDALAT
eukprot:11175268-Lingulodinium_polyedra.AAC.3